MFAIGSNRTVVGTQTLLTQIAEERGGSVNVEEAVIGLERANLLTGDLAHEVFEGQCGSSCTSLPACFRMMARIERLTAATRELLPEQAGPQLPGVPPN